MIYSVTGHRPNKLNLTSDFSHPAWQEIRAWFERKFEGVDRVITGGAMGVDILAAKVALDAGVPHLIALPYDSFVDGFGSRHRKRLEYVIERSEVHVVSPGDYEVWKLHRRNEWMVGNSDKLVGVWNGTPGGTAACIRYARSKHHPYEMFEPTFALRLTNG